MVGQPGDPLLVGLHQSVADRRVRAGLHRLPVAERVGAPDLATRGRCRAADLVRLLDHDDRRAGFLGAAYGNQAADTGPGDDDIRGRFPAAALFSNRGLPH